MTAPEQQASQDTDNPFEVADYWESADPIITDRLPMCYARSTARIVGSLLFQRRILEAVSHKTADLQYFPGASIDVADLAVGSVLAYDREGLYENTAMSKLDKQSVAPEGTTTEIDYKLGISPMELIRISSNSSKNNSNKNSIRPGRVIVKSGIPEPVADGPRVMEYWREAWFAIVLPVRKTRQLFTYPFAGRELKLFSPLNKEARSLKGNAALMLGAVTLSHNSAGRRLFERINSAEIFVPEPQEVDLAMDELTKSRPFAKLR